MNTVRKQVVAVVVLAVSLAFARLVEAQDSLVVKAAPSGPNKSTTSPVFVDVPDLSAAVSTPPDGRMAITVAAEAGTTGGKRMFVRVLVDGKPVRPSDVVFASGNLSGVRSFTFGTDKLPAGTHSVKVQWLVDQGGTAFIGDRTLSVQVFPGQGFGKFGQTDVVVAPSGPNRQLNASERFVDVPDLRAMVASPAGGQLTITVSAEVDAGTSLSLRALVDGQPADPSGVPFASGPSQGVRSFTFVKSGLSFGGHTVQIQYAGTGSLGDRSLAVHADTANSKQVGVAVAAQDAPGTYLVPGTRFPAIVTTVRTTGAGLVPGLSTAVTTGPQGRLMITVSAEAYVDAGRRLFIRPLVDGKATQPADVLFVVGNEPRGTRSFTFAVEGLAQGSHQVEVHWAVDPGATGQMGCRTLAVLAGQSGPSTARARAPEAPDSTSARVRAPAVSDASMVRVRAPAVSDPSTVRVRAPEAPDSSTVRVRAPEAPADSQTPRIAGDWDSNIGLVYSIAQSGNQFTYTLNTGGGGKGTISGNNVTATWIDQNGTHTLNGRVTRQDASRVAFRMSFDGGIELARRL